ncbi:RICIN domain-containing protein [Antarctobacter sp.]|uniref:RICIN domain-containing protein n=1 Tax=Antarctobacter sp. TaxID=1872577 RepID=UPI002B27A531|nr:RICIN domain-containing protein [Antarctobacter sp.]
MKKLFAAFLAVVVAGPAVAQDFSGTYRLQTMFQAPENKCFEGNRYSPDSTLGGAAFMDTCQNVTGQMWKIQSQGNGWYRLKTIFQGEGKCLEGNRYAPESTLGGAAFMDNCQNVSGQLWKIESQGDGWYRLKTQFQGEGKCLEGNRYSPESTLGGAAFMDNCQNVSGQLWKFVNAGN